MMNMPADMRRKLPIGIQSFEFLRSGKAFCFPLLKLISKGKKNCSKGLPSSSWNRSGWSIPCCILI